MIDGSKIIDSHQISLSCWSFHKWSVVVCLLGVCAPGTVSSSCSLYINVVQYTKGFFPACVFIIIIIIFHVNTVQTFAYMNVWWDALQLCVFCLLVLCWHPKRSHIPLTTTVFMHNCNFTVWIWMPIYCDGCILYCSNRPIFHFKFYSRTLIQWK
jgi:hypothetical protein